MFSREPLYTSSFHVMYPTFSLFVIYYNRVHNIFTYIQFQLLVSMVVLYVEMQNCRKTRRFSFLEYSCNVCYTFWSTYKEAHVKKGVAVICLVKFNAEFDIILPGILNLPAILLGNDRRRIHWVICDYLMVVFYLRSKWLCAKTIFVAICFSEMFQTTKYHFL